jgi:hypothetical protein
MEYTIHNIPLPKKIKITLFSVYMFTGQFEVALPTKSLTPKISPRVLLKNDQSLQQYIMLCLKRLLIINP